MGSNSTRGPKSDKKYIFLKSKNALKYHVLQPGNKTIQGEVGYFTFFSRSDAIANARKYIYDVCHVIDVFTYVYVHVHSGKARAKLRKICFNKILKNPKN